MLKVGKLVSTTGNVLNNKLWDHPDNQRILNEVAATLGVFTLSGWHYVKYSHIANVAGQKLADQLYVNTNGNTVF
jgi:hypothetical protein